MEQEILLSSRIPVLPLRGMTVFPEMLCHFDVAREKSVKAIDAAMERDRRIFLVQQRELEVDDPKGDDLCKIGTVAIIRQTLKMPGEVVRVLVEGEYRAQLSNLEQLSPYWSGRVESVPDESSSKLSARAEALIRQSFSLFEQYAELMPKGGKETLLRLLAADEPGFIADFIGQHASFHYKEKQKLLEQRNPIRRLERANKDLAREVQVRQMEAELNEKVQESLNHNQHEYFLREQLRVIHEELGDEDEEQEFAEYEQKIHDLKLAQQTEEKLLKELGRLRKQPLGSSEAAVIRSYLDTVLSLPWNTSTRERLDVAQARKMLDEDHFGLEKVKERILETIAVRKLTPDMPPQILCLVGPPGIGKTSIAMSIARCLNRNLARISLGGVHDEADIRGHRKTYIGAMPGRILAGVAQAKSNNPLLLLDEIDKMGADYRGDPASALLEVLDGEQNATFRDHYAEVPFDLSRCMFITTANTLDTVLRPLLDRMEVIELGSYTDEEKLQIAKRHLLPKQQKKHGIAKAQLRVSDDALREIIYGYTRESGVRTLERELAHLCRKTALRLSEEDAPKRITVTGKNLEQLLGVRKYLPERAAEQDTVGLVTGLAWTSVGGETLEVEVNVMEGSGKVEVTGNLGKVMQESASAAVSYIRANAAKIGVAPDFYKTKDIHIHFPEGAIPKDGPSAGITMCTAIVSALTGAPVRRDVAMTGEISIRGRVLPIGGLKEKTMAALRHGVKTVIIPAENEKDLEQIDQTVRRALQFITVSHVDAVLDYALRHETQTHTGHQQALAIPVTPPETRHQTTALQQ